ncbi:hypothetical protein ACGFIV_00780 [Sphaerisporangium sp. NPDC049003]|uniref:hypothetical protein n=1 Tax=Sphaerisporangium sp. NPDC049003 TaxID=3364517 RepID=UPI0037241556
MSILAPTLPPAGIPLLVIDERTGLRRSAIRWPDGNPPPVGGCRWCGFTWEVHQPDGVGDRVPAGRCPGFDSPTSAQRRARAAAHAARVQAFREVEDELIDRLLAGLRDGAA